MKKFSLLTTGRDPFARLTIRKRRITSKIGCHWCGSPYHMKPNVRLWTYYIDADNPRESRDLKGAFCGIQCARAYHS